MNSSLKVTNNVKQFIKDNNINLFQLLGLIAIKKRIKPTNNFPLNNVRLAYYFVGYTYLEENQAQELFNNLNLAINFVKTVDVKLENGEMTNYYDPELREKLKTSVPVTFVQSAVERGLSESAKMIISFTKTYRSHIEQNIPFTADDVDLYLQTKSADTYLYLAILESVLGRTDGQIQTFFSLLQQMNDIVDDVVDYKEDREKTQPNIINIAKNLSTKPDINNFISELLANKEKEITMNGLPGELDYLLGFPKLLIDVAGKQHPEK